jgi:hypothetical protein
MKTFTLALVASTAAASKGWGKGGQLNAGYGLGAGYGYGAPAKTVAVYGGHGPTNFIDEYPVQHSHYEDIVVTQDYTVDDSTTATITNTGTRQELSKYDDTRIDTKYDDVPETRVRDALVTNVEAKGQNVSTTSYSTKSVDAGLKDVTRYDVADQVVDEDIEQFRVDLEDRAILESEVAYDTVTSTRDNYITINKLCPITKTREVTVTVPDVKLVDVDIVKTKKVASSKLVKTTVVDKKKVCYNKQNDWQCDWDWNCKNNSGWNWNKTEWNCKWISEPRWITKRVPTYELVNYTETITKEVPTTKQVIQTEEYTENEACTETINYPTTVTQEIPRTVLIDAARQVEVSSIEAIDEITAVPISVGRTEQQSYTTTIPEKRVDSRVDYQDYNVQSLEDAEYEVITKVARDVPVTRQRSQYNDVEKVTSYDTKIQGTKTLQQDLIRQKRIDGAHSDRAGYGHGPELYAYEPIKSIRYDEPAIIVEKPLIVETLVSNVGKKW